MKSRTHKNAITDPIEIYEHSAALRDLEGFTDNYYVYEIDTSDWNGSIKTVSVDEKQYYRGTGCNVSYKLTKDSATGDLFTTQYAYTDKKIYIWLSNDGAHTVKVDNKVIGSGITQSNVK